MSQSQSEENDFQTSSSAVYVNRRQYLLTYSQADLQKFPTRESFGRAVEACFSASGKVIVEYWACCLERHENTGGYHYHVSVKLSGPKRWGPVKNAMIARHGIVLNFSDVHDNYYSAFNYVTKTDKEVFKSVAHPDLQEIGSPKTKICIQAYKKKQAKSEKLRTM